MKYIKVFSEINELRSETYRRAGTKMITDYKQVKRGTNLIDYSYQVTRNKYKKYGTFECDILNLRNSLIGNDKVDDILATGNFHVAMNIDTEWFVEGFIDKFFTRKYLPMPYMGISIGLLPADDETLNKMIKIQDKITDYADNIYWINLLYVPITGLDNDTESNILVESNGGDFIEFRFTNRIDGNKFKKLLVDAFEDKNDFGAEEHNFYKASKLSSYMLGLFESINKDIYYYMENGYYDTETIFEDDEIPFYDAKKSYDYFKNKIKKLSVNKLYRD